MPAPESGNGCCSKMVTTVPEEFIQASMDVEKALRLMSGFEPSHLRLSLSGGLV